MSLFDGQVPLLKPWLGEEEAAAAREAILSGWVSLGPKVAEFEAAIAKLVGAKHAVATNAATTALHLALKVQGIGPGDEVLVPTTTCMANANAIVLAGAKPAFGDVDPRTFNLDPADAEKRIGPRTKAIMLVDQIGQPADLDAFKDLAKRKGIALVDDAATAFGARYKGTALGGHGVPSVFSFHPRKMITTGEGGMLVTDDDRWAERARVVRSSGASVSDLERHKAKGTILQQYFEPGYNYRLTDIQAAIGIVQLGKLPEMLRQRREQAAKYDAAFAGIAGVHVPYVPSWAEPSWSSYCLRITAEAKVTAAEMVRRMAEKNVSCRHGIPPLHVEPCFADEWKGARFPGAEAVARETMFLPIFPGMTEEQQRHVIESFRTAIRA